MADGASRELRAPSISTMPSVYSSFYLYLSVSLTHLGRATEGYPIQLWSLESGAFWAKSLRHGGPPRTERGGPAGAGSGLDTHPSQIPVKTMGQECLFLGAVESLCHGTGMDFILKSWSNRERPGKGALRLCKNGDGPKGWSSSSREETALRGLSRW